MSNAAMLADKKRRIAGGRIPMRRPPALKPGQVLRTIERRHSEQYADAVARGSLLSWWPLRTHEQPYCTGRAWIWLVQL